MRGGQKSDFWDVINEWPLNWKNIGRLRITYKKIGSIQFKRYIIILIAQVVK